MLRRTGAILFLTAARPPFDFAPLHRALPYKACRCRRRECYQHDASLASKCANKQTLISNRRLSSCRKTTRALMHAVVARPPCLRALLEETNQRRNTKYLKGLV
jgi:hypothetical protein